MNKLEFHGAATLLSLLAALAFVGCGDDVAPICDGAVLTAALASATSGDVVRIGECEVTGAFIVPAGVTIAGSSRTLSVIHGQAGAVALKLIAGPVGEPTRATSMTIRVDGSVGVYAKGGGEIALADVTVTTTSASATHGVVLDGLGGAALTNVDVSGFAGRGVFVVGGNATFSQVRVTGTLAFAGTPGFGVAITDGAKVTTTGLTVTGTTGIGVFHNMAQGTHTDLVSSDNSLPGVWVQNTPTALSFAISGAASALHGNGGAGLVAVDARNLSIADVTVDASRSADVFGTTYADGLQFVRTFESVALRDLAVANNPRTQLIFRAGAAPMAATDMPSFTNVSVDGTGAALGCVDDESFLEVWDLAVVRLGATMVNDDAFSFVTTPIGTAEVIGPMSFPARSELAPF